MCRTHDIKSVNEIRGGAWVEQNNLLQDALSETRCHGCDLQKSTAHLGSAPLLTSLQVEESNLVGSPLFFLLVNNAR